MTDYLIFINMRRQKAPSANFKRTRNVSERKDLIFQIVDPHPRETAINFITGPIETSQSSTKICVRGNKATYQHENVARNFAEHQSWWKGQGRRSGQEAEYDLIWALITSKANLALLFYIRENITNRMNKIIIPLYSALVRLLLEYCIHFWVPVIKSNMQKPEKATTMVWSLEDINTNRDWESWSSSALHRGG